MHPKNGNRILKTVLNSLEVLNKRLDEQFCDKLKQYNARKLKYTRKSSDKWLENPNLECKWIILAPKKV